MIWGTGLLQSEARAGSSPLCPHPWDPSPAYVSCWDTSKESLWPWALG